MNNVFGVNLCLADEILFSWELSGLEDYLYALENTDGILYDGKEYKLDNVKIIHGEGGGNMNLTLKVALKEPGEKRQAHNAGKYR